MLKSRKVYFYYGLDALELKSSMTEIGSQGSDANTVPGKAGSGYDLNQVIETCQQRIQNLEQFRELFFDLQDQVRTGVVSAKMLAEPGPPKTESVDSNERNQQTSHRIKELKEFSTKQLKIVVGLQNTLKSLEIQDEGYRYVVEQQLVDLATMGKQLEESKSCGEMIESELERLVEENAALKNQLQETEAEANHSPQPNQIETSSDEAGTEVAEQIAESKLHDEGLAVSTEELRSGVDPQDLSSADIKIQMLQAEVEQATELAFGSMRSNADLGAVVHFLMQCFSCDELDKLAKQIFITLTNYGVTGVFQIRHEGKSFHYGPDGDGDSMGINLIQKHADGGELVELGDRLLANGERSSLIVWGYDSSNPIAYNDLKDNLKMVVLGADSNSKRIFTELAVERERSMLEKLIATTGRALNKFEKDLNNQSLQAQNNIRDLVDEFRATVGKQSIDNEQKNVLLKVVVGGVSKVETVIKAVKIDPGFSHIIKTLSDSVGGNRNATKNNVKK